VHIDPSLQLGDALDVHDERGLQAAIAEPDDEVGTAGQDASLRTVRVEECDRLVDGDRSLIGERAHRAATPAC
jgi:hypothetical protein